MIGEILSFLKIFSMRKTTTQFFFIIFKILEENRQKKAIFLAYFGPLKANYRLFLRLLTLHYFIQTLITVFFICIILYICICFFYFLFLCFYFHLLFLLFSPQNTFYNLQCFIQFHCKLPVTLRR